MKSTIQQRSYILRYMFLTWEGDKNEPKIKPQLLKGSIYEKIEQRVCIYGKHTERTNEFEWGLKIGW